LLLAGGLTLRPDRLAGAGGQEDSSSPPRFSNTAPTVKFVGPAACRECHPVISRRFEGTPHMRSTTAATVDTLAFALRGRDRLRVRGVDRAVEYVLTRRDNGLSFSYALHGRGDDAQTFPVEYRVGSGRQGISLLAREPGGRLWQVPVSYFTEVDRWDLSPGFAALLHQYGPFFRRHIPQACLTCHATYLELEPSGKLGPLVHGVSCEKCHGPGAVHVRHWRARARRGERGPRAEADLTIVNPKRLPPDLQMEICAECHTRTLIPREGKAFQFRPGQRLESFYERRVSDTGAQHTEAESLAGSACFERTAGKERLACVVCHAPHEPPTRGPSVYDGVCLGCHAGAHEASAVRRVDCVGCHMPARRTDFGHGRFRNHRIAVY
jgi:cytochrome c554/c'-like protein